MTIAQETLLESPMRSGTGSVRRLLSWRDVPKTVPENLAWRDYLWTRAKQDEDVRAVVYQTCARDVRFYFNSFVWIFEPRPKPRCLPFISWPSQDKLIRAGLQAVEGGTSLVVLKSRDTGITITLVALSDWLCRFTREMSGLFMSRVEDNVDKKDDPDSLFGKLDYIEERLPSFLKCRGRERTRLHLRYPRTRAIIDGESTTPDAGRSRRRTFVLRDEEAAAENGFEIDRSLSDTTRCQWRVSTPQGMGNSFHSAVEGGQIEKIVIHWSEHPEKNPGLYKVDLKGNVEILDKAWHAGRPDYKFAVEPGGYEGLRSPWYDNECRIRNSKVNIAQELDLDFGGSGSPFFPHFELMTARSWHAWKPVAVGKAADFLPFGEDGLPQTFDDPSEKPARLWFNPRVDRLPPQNTTYSIGVDISAGTGASDTAISVGDDSTKTKIFEYASPRISPEEAAGLVIAICRWFSTPIGTAYLIWDAGAHGGPFGEKIVGTYRYAPIYHYVNLSERGERRIARKPGYPGTREGKLKLMVQYRDALFSGKFITYSDEAYRQCEEFVYDGSNGVQHARALSRGNEDRASSGEQHGDIATSEALLWLAMTSRPAPVPPVFEYPQDISCFAYRNELHRHMKQSGKRWYN